MRVTRPLTNAHKGGPLGGGGFSPYLQVVAPPKPRSKRGKNSTGRGGKGALFKMPGRSDR